MTAGRTNHTMFAAAPAVMQALEPKSSSVGSITDGELMSLMLTIDPRTQRVPPGIRAIVDAVLALAEQRSAAKPTEAEGEAYTQGYFDGLSAQPAQVAAPELVAEVVSWTNSSYSRNYKIRWVKDVDEGTKLYALPLPAAPKREGGSDATR